MTEEKEYEMYLAHGGLPGRTNRKAEMASVNILGISLIASFVIWLIVKGILDYYLADYEYTNIDHFLGGDMEPLSWLTVVPFLFMGYIIYFVIRISQKKKRINPKQYD